VVVIHLILRKNSGHAYRNHSYSGLDIYVGLAERACVGMVTGETSWTAVIRKTKKDMESNINVC
jgi:hypothetical protein